MFAAARPNNVPHVVIQHCWLALHTRLVPLYAAVRWTGFLPRAWQNASAVVLKKPKKDDYSLPPGSSLSPIFFLLYNAALLRLAHTPSSCGFGWIDNVNILAWGPAASQAVWKDAARAVCGGYCSAAASALEVEANLVPLNLVIRSLFFRLALRALSTPPAHLLHEPCQLARPARPLRHPFPLHTGLHALLVGFSDRSLKDGFAGAASAVWGGQQMAWEGKAEGAQLTLLTAIPLLLLHHSPSLTLLIDNQTVLLAPTDPSPTSGQHLRLQLRSLLTRLHLSLPLVQVRLMWCPGHAGIEGNELVDLLAKDAAEEGARRAGRGSGG
ncbi:hypothetical protein JCM11251_008025, partial [Rhodosporidiobolus azoricus]